MMRILEEEVVDAAISEAEVVGEAGALTSPPWNVSIAIN